MEVSIMFNFVHTAILLSIAVRVSMERFFFQMLQGISKTIALRSILNNYRGISIARDKVFICAIAIRKYCSNSKTFAHILFSLVCFFSRNVQSQPFI